MLYNLSIYFVWKLSEKVKNPEVTPSGMSFINCLVDDFAAITRELSAAAGYMFGVTFVVVV